MNPLTLSFADQAPDGHRLDVVVRAGGAARRVTFSANVPLTARGDALVALGLLPAIELGLDLAVEATISPLLLDRLPGIQTLFCSWYPACRPVRVSTHGPEDAPGGAGTGMFFSGGADSFYSLLENADRADTLITVLGADISFGNETGRERLEALARHVAAELGVTPVIVATDLRGVFDRMAGWDDFHGSALAAIGHLLSGQIGTAIIAASADEIAQRYPWGSGPLLDPLWSSAAVAFEHHGCVPRTEKFARLIESPLAMGNLRVCYLHEDAGNCGVCAKCTYARAALAVLGAERHDGLFPPGPLNLPALRVTDIASETKHEALAKAARAAGRQDITDAAQRALASFRRRQMAYSVIPMPAARRRFRQMKRRARLRAGTLI